ncbi:MAG: 3-hydroxyacyl-CoA dehydrogenase [Alphaproteobacteria bacterium]|jgi:NAD(P)-dependent dehydrogenase (short-subunit alcohol dehydrogenase family)|nr:3-hydroxyacyl-CoA dehydrogenase [Alphaproteobacteria bacterium]PPR14316.1 MAG: putative oxidoreductase [Alphaproteobacteria bacterium MarineAlpha12_Bin1]|tara:strand:- start:3016 stop:3777 length:762 start_codon:yes stop_codon:yes gene_type:complete
MDINNSSVIITGGGSGLGAATAKLLSEKTSKIALLDVHIEGAKETAKKINGLAIECDVSDPDSASKAISLAKEAHGTAKILVNCAGIGPGAAVVGRTGPVDLDWFEKTVSVNLTGTFNMIRLTAANMIKEEPNQEGERGVIINTGSTSAYEGQIGQTAYAASKAGVVGMGIALAREFAREGIRVMTISPGPFDTPLFGSMPSNAHQRLLDATQFPKRAGNPDEYGRLVKCIIENPMLNGESIRLDGAIRMGPR